MDSPVTGTNVLRVVHFGRTPPCVFSAGYVSNLPHSTYTLSVYLKTDKVRLPVYLGTSRGGRDRKVFATRDWQRFSLTDELTGTVKASFLPGAAGTLWITAPQLEAEPECTPYHASTADVRRVQSDDEWLPAKPPVLTCPRTPLPPVLDGVLNEACWQEAALAAGFKECRTGDAATPGTTVLVMRGSENLYVSFRCTGAGAANTEAQSSRESTAEASVFESDAVEVFLCVRTDARHYCHFGVNRHGEMYDALGKAQQWDSGWRTSVGLLDGGWCVEMAIPFSSLHLGEENRTWRVNFCRNRPGDVNREASCWSHAEDRHALD